MFIQKNRHKRHKSLTLTVRNSKKATRQHIRHKDSVAVNGRRRSRVDREPVGCQLGERCSGGREHLPPWTRPRRCSRMHPTALCFGFLRTFGGGVVAGQEVRWLAIAFRGLAFLQMLGLGFALVSASVSNLGFAFTLASMSNLFGN